MPTSIMEVMSRSGKMRSGKKTVEKYARGTRSYTMSHIRGKDTSIEVMVRQYLFSRGLRFRKNDKRYPGHPDVVLPRWHAIVFVNGCFWHMHEGCPKQSMPKSHVEFWSAKLLRNRERDRLQHATLAAQGWHVIVVWECELSRDARERRLERLYEEITGGESCAWIPAGGGVDSAMATTPGMNSATGSGLESGLGCDPDAGDGVEKGDRAGDDSVPRDGMTADGG